MKISFNPNLHISQIFLSLTSGMFSFISGKKNILKTSVVFQVLPLSLENIVKYAYDTGQRTCTI